MELPGFFSPLGILNNGLANAIYVLGITDEDGRYAHFTQVTFAENKGGYYVPDSLRLNLNTIADASKSMLILPGDSVHFSFEDRPRANLYVRYLVLGDPLATPQILQVQLK